MYKQACVPRQGAVWASSGIHPIHYPLEEGPVPIPNPVISRRGLNGQTGRGALPLTRPGRQLGRLSPRAEKKEERGVDDG